MDSGGGGNGSTVVDAYAIILSGDELNVLAAVLELGIDYASQRNTQVPVTIGILDKVNRARRAMKRT